MADSRPTPALSQGLPSRQLSADPREHPCQRQQLRCLEAAQMHQSWVHATRQQLQNCVLQCTLSLHGPWNECRSLTVSQLCDNRPASAASLNVAVLAASPSQHQSLFVLAAAFRLPWNAEGSAALLHGDPCFHDPHHAPSDANGHETLPWRGAQHQGEAPTWQSALPACCPKRWHGRIRE